MKQSLGCLLLLEVFICFGSLLLDVSLGLIFLPDWIGDLFREPPDEHSSLPSILLTLAGVLGTLGIGATLRLIQGWSPSRRTVRVIQALVAIGVAAVVFSALNNGILTHEFWEDGIRPGIVVPIVFEILLPLACSAHLVYLARHQLLR